jgi:putative DNA primase/helicase
VIEVRSIPLELKQLNQWVLTEKDTKEPYAVAGNRKYCASCKDPDDWSTFDNAVKALNQSDRFVGIAFAITEPYAMIDLDKQCIGGNLSYLARDIINRLDSYTELSMSGNGIHIIVKTSNNDIYYPEQPIEIYSRTKFMTLTGKIFENRSVINEREAELNEIIKAYKLIKPQSTPRANNTPIERTPQDTDEMINEFIDRAIDKAKSGGRNNAGLYLASQLRDHDISVSEAESVIERYQSQVCDMGDHEYDREEAIASLKSAYKQAKRESWWKPMRNHSSIGKSNTDKAVNPVTEQAEKPIMPFRLTDYGNAERLVYYHGDNIRYCEAMKSWFIWDGKRWKVDDCLEIERLAKDTVRRIYNEAGNSDNENQRKAIADHAKRSEANNKIQAMVSLAKSESGVIIRPNDLDRNGFLLNCENGTIDLRTGELLPHRKMDNITKIIPVNFDKTAECSRWELFLKEIFKDDKDLITFIKYAVGYSLTGSIKEECIFICYGTGRNGKSKYLDTLEFIFGDYGKNVLPTTFEEQQKFSGSASEDIARLKNIRFISTVETAEGRRLSESLVKKMTGDRIITARELYQKSFQFEQAYKIWLATNHKPIIRGTDNAIWERIKLIPFEVYFSEEKRDKDLLEKLIAEAPGILNWAIEGCLLWQGMGLYPVTAGKVKDATNDYRVEMDLIGEFIKDKCIQKDDISISKQFLYNAYSEWCKESGLNPEPKIKFGRKLKESYNIKDDSGTDNVSIWKGLALKYIHAESQQN